MSEGEVETTETAGVVEQVIPITMSRQQFADIIGNMSYVLCMYENILMKKFNMPYEDISKNFADKTYSEVEESKLSIMSNRVFGLMSAIMSGELTVQSKPEEVPPEEKPLIIAP